MPHRRTRAQFVRAAVGDLPHRQRSRLLHELTRQPKLCSAHRGSDRTCAPTPTSVDPPREPASAVSAVEGVSELSSGRAGLPVLWLREAHKEQANSIYLTTCAPPRVACCAQLTQDVVSSSLNARCAWTFLGCTGRRVGRRVRSQTSERSERHRRGICVHANDQDRHRCSEQ